MKVERLNKTELNEYCKSLGIDIKKKNKAELIKAVYVHQRAEIDEAIAAGSRLDLLKSKISSLADQYAGNLREKITTESHVVLYTGVQISANESGMKPLCGSPLEPR